MQNQPLPSAPALEEQPAPSATEKTRKVFTAIAAVMADMAKLGVGKNQKNTQQNFQYRGIDDVMDALSPSLARHGLIVTPRVRSREVTERESRQGGKLFHTVLVIDYAFISATDGSSYVVGPIYGESMDTGDKSINKAMAAAYKYACTQTFCIPFSADDPDASTHEVAGAARDPDKTQPESGRVVSDSKPAAPARPSVPNVAPKTRAEVPMAADGRPRLARPGGLFGYGKKFADTPWEVMHARDLEWFLGAERTPANIRERIVIELAWRDWETSQLEASRERQRQDDEAALKDEAIP